MLVRNLCSRRKIETRYVPLTNAAISVYRDLFPDDLIDVRLMGSVARGEAVPGESDIDFMGLARTPPRPDAVAELADRGRQLHREPPVVSRVDLDADWIGGLPVFRRFILSSDSIGLFGPDHLIRRRQYVDRTWLVRLVTPDADELLRDYRRAVCWIGLIGTTATFFSFRHRRYQSQRSIIPSRSKSGRAKLIS